MRKAGDKKNEEAAKATMTTGDADTRVYSMSLDKHEPNGVDGPAPVCRQVQQEAMRFISIYNMGDIMNWLGNDFYAVTKGDPIVINGQSISVKAPENRNANDPYSPFDEMLLIIHDPIASCIRVIGRGMWVVRDPNLGYHVLTDDEFRKQYASATKQAVLATDVISNT